MSVRVRFAPSPTGPLHLGNARTALFNWLFARAHGGRFILRVEDTDPERSRKEFEAAILDDLRWLGLDWDEGPDVGGVSGPYRQSERLSHYQEAASRLLGDERAYWCFCDPLELESRRRRTLVRGKPPRYDGRCGRLPRKEVGARLAAGRKAALRVRVNQGPVVVRDLVKGVVEFRGEDLDDFVVLRSDGLPTYNFAAVVDDSAMAVSHVIRGDDHLSNTPRQLILYQALGAGPPAFAHLPLIHGSDGAPLSKRHGAVSVEEYRAAGILPEALVNYLALLGWSPSGDEGEVHDPKALSGLFSLDRVSGSPARFDSDRLMWFNRQHLRRLPTERLLRFMEPYPADGVTARAVEVLRREVDSLVALKRAVAEIRAEPEPYTLKLTEADEGALRQLRGRLVVDGPFETEEDAQRILAEATRDLSPEARRSFMRIERLLLTGQPHGIPVATLLWILGPDHSGRRLARAITALVGS